MNVRASGTGFAFFCEDFTPALRDPLSCELCGCLEQEHPVLAGEGELEPAATSPRPLLVEPEEWLADMRARYDEAARRIVALGNRLDVIDAELRAFKRRRGLT